MFNFCANLFGYLLNFIYQFVNNYGIAIILFTVLLRLVMLPISINQQKTMKKSAKMQEKVKEIQEKYSNDQVRQSQELMDLYKRENMSPFSGCLTSIVQFIIILSVFYLVSRPLTYMKHIDKDIIQNYSSIITEQNDGKTPNYQEIAIINNFSDKDESLRINMDFLGLNLSDVPSEHTNDFKVFIIPVLYVITSIVSTRITMAMTQSKKNKEENKDKNIIVVSNDDKAKEESQNEEDAMAQMNKQMGLMVPVMSVMIALVAPLGLALYWLVSNLLLLCERIIINKIFKDQEEA